ncbi:MAG: hypothetical protein ACREL7_09945 [Longimicrobiales bacterium]
MTGAQTSNGARALADTFAGLIDAPARVAAALASTLARGGSPGCQIPPPCWEPRPSGTCRLAIPPGCPGTIRVNVTNCEWNRRIVGITALGKLAGWLTFQPTTLVLDPHESATFIVTVHVPDGVKPGFVLSGPLIIRGCLDHFAHIEVRVTECAGQTCCDLAVHDCQDHVHHWYDHFYCQRPCRNPVIRDVKDG